MVQPFKKYFVSLQHDSCENAPARQMRTCSLCTRLIASLWRKLIYLVEYEVSEY
jgi:hypothetical protein